MKPVIGITADLDDKRMILNRDYLSAIEDAGGVPLVLSPVREGIDRIAGIIDGLLLSGGDDLLPEYLGEEVSVPMEVFKFVKKERTDFEIELFREVMRRGKPILGICYGMQLINILLGGSIYQDISLQSKGAFSHREGVHGVKIINPGYLQLDLQSREFTVNSSHHQAVRTPGEEMEVFALSDDGIIEGVYRKDYPFLVGVQWHPEKGINRAGLKGGRNRYDELSQRILEAFIIKTSDRSGQDKR